jgi:ABC-2 type transport system permease protein
MVLAAQATVSLVQAVLGTALALTVAVLAFDANPPIHLGAAFGVASLTISAPRSSSAWRWRPFSSAGNEGHEA